MSCANRTALFRVHYSGTHTWPLVSSSVHEAIVAIAEAFQEALEMRRSRAQKLVSERRMSRRTSPALSSGDAGSRQTVQTVQALRSSRSTRGISIRSQMTEELLKGRVAQSGR